MTHDDILFKIYEDALKIAFSENVNNDSISEDVKKDIEFIVIRSEFNKGMLTVLTTLLVHKVVNPLQDIRFHQAGMENGFAGRRIDQNFVTPFMKSVSLKWYPKTRQ